MGITIINSYIWKKCYYSSNPGQERDINAHKYKVMIRLLYNQAIFSLVAVLVYNS